LTDDGSLGDSGYVHISPFRLSHRSAPQTHSFNAPYQLAKIPSRMRAQMRLFGGLDAQDGYYRANGGHYEELPSDADVYGHEVAHGDVLVLATDGVWDNLAAQDVLRTVCGVMVRQGAWRVPDDGDGAEAAPAKIVMPGFAAMAAGGEGDDGLPSLVAAEIVRAAKMASLDARRDSPFTKELRRHHPDQNYTGGKPDDICVVVVLAVGST
jgi:protein phosphatase PTC7